MPLAHIFTVIGFLFMIAVIIAVIIILLILFIHDRTQKRHPILRNYPVLGKVRYFLEAIGPEMRQYWFNSDKEGRPFSRDDYEHVVKTAKYKRDVLGFGSKRDFEEEGYYVRNHLFPKQMHEMKIDREIKVKSKKYVLEKDSLFGNRRETFVEDESLAYLLEDEDVVTIGKETCRYPFTVKGLIGMSAMSYGALGKNAITALSEGLGMAKGTWMNTGEGGLSSYHLKGGVDIIMQIGPGLFGVRDKEGQFDWDELKRKSEIPQIKAFELKLAQGAKARGGHVDGEKVTPEIAEIRKVEPWKSVDSPNRFNEFSDPQSMLDWIEKIRQHTGKPVGCKLVVGSNNAIFDLAAAMKASGKAPDFITVDGGEGGTGASYQELIDSVGLPIRSALPILDATLRRFGVRDRVRIIASGKMITPDRIAIALAMGADLINIARGFMITVGCIQALKCHSNICPTGVATTDPHLQRALVIDEKKWRVVNYVVSLRKGLFRIAAAAGIDSPIHFRPSHISYKDDVGIVQSLVDVYKAIDERVQAEPYPIEDTFATK
ncbi:glutamate synthase (ferredoxin) [Pullulanibacillus pueri]|uniref:Glutamate synthase large subunit-like protein YerD n=1 Tax=Pullulanibacillus pueri TaxID=1437324 RepID=A0A8J2ZX01_9BACL|nr:FMN-binding glutamate synthase family protein [Pullulanibacillus pueri]MBM7680656.1 glutamate synthase (ferredoxin) [Pullulanibacillus pueri]GGH83827.1 glutamate synthase large subunit-like protein YerD [Pullulanibacillus pueri]